MTAAAGGKRLTRPVPWLLWPRISSLSGLRAGLAAEAAAQLDRAMLGAPVALGLGAAAYFALHAEPPLAPLLAAAGLAGLAFAAALRWSPSRALIVLAAYVFLFAAGLAGGRIRTLRVEAPVLPAARSTVIEGWVTDVASSAAGKGRLVIAPTAIGGVAPADLPNRIRVSAPADLTTGPGRAIRMAAFLSPPPGPASPGAYDFARDEFFQGIGAVGFSRAAPEFVTLAAPPWPLRLEMGVNALRWDLSRRIAGDMHGDAAGLGVAMITGYQAWLGDAAQTDLRSSGLAHIVSISGVHMAIVGGFAFLLVRTLVACWPWLALRVPGKKVAAGAGILVIGLYLVVSGAPPPAQRSAITAVLAFSAILVDRRAISLHVLAVAALAILVLQPEAVVQPGFQMSFAATTALVALAEAWPQAPRPISIPWPIRFVQDAASWLMISLGVSFVAGLATDPFAIQHFNRVSLYGLGANLVTEPLATFVIMPALALGALFDTVGLGGPLLAIAEWGIDALFAVSHWFAQAPWAVWTTPSKPDGTLVAAFLGILFVALWRGRLRWLGLPFAFAVALSPPPPAPELWVSADASAAATHRDQTAWLLRPKVKLFAAEIWARRRGFDLEDDAPVRTRAFDCDRRICGAVTPSGAFAILWWIRRAPTAAELDDLCRWGELIVVRAQTAPSAPRCGGRTIVTGADFARGGAAEFYRQGRGWAAVWSQDVRGRRPWSVNGSDE
ncbi:MAG TPA: ComEC/Rec2 family competence protein [Caulobacteraceae bacterium]|nr:ComEC/Rec2 family competence protein [Caulobacteraceae bacterium]